MKTITTNWTFANGKETTIEASIDSLGILTIIDLETKKCLDDEYSLDNFPELKSIERIKKDISKFT